MAYQQDAHFYKHLALSPFQYKKLLESNSFFFNPSLIKESLRFLKKISQHAQKAYWLIMH